MSRCLAPAPLAREQVFKVTLAGLPESRWRALGHQVSWAGGGWVQGQRGRRPHTPPPPLAVQQPGAEEPPHQCGPLDPHPAEPGDRVGRPRRRLLPGKPRAPLLPPQPWSFLKSPFPLLGFRAISDRLLGLGHLPLLRVHPGALTSPFTAPLFPQNLNRTCHREERVPPRSSFLAELSKAPVLVRMRATPASGHADSALPPGWCWGWPGVCALHQLPQAPSSLPPPPRAAPWPCA